MFDERPDMDDLPHTFWNCNVYHAENSCYDGECQYCECEGAACKRNNCSGESHPYPCEKCGNVARTEAIHLHGYTENLCEPCARVEAPYMFSN